MTGTLSRRAFQGLALSSFIAAGESARAAEWPAKPVRIVVAFGAGGTADVLARVLGNALSDMLKQQFYVDNVPGSSGAIGSAQVARAEPDGYTLLIGGAGPHLVGPAVNPNVGYDTMRDFTHIAMIAGDSFMLAASKGLGVKTFAELLEKDRGKSLACGSPGVGSQGHLLQVLINQQTGLKLDPVPYRGANEAMMDVISDHIPLALQPAISVVGQTSAGTAVALAVTAAKRSAVLGDTPTFGELGYPGLEAVSWFWLTGPRGIPADIVGRLNTATREALKRPEVRKQLDSAALQTLDLDPAATTAFIRSEVEKWRGAAQAANLKIQ